MSVDVKIFMFVVVVSVSNISLCFAKKIAMKVVEEPSSYGMNLGYQGQSNTDTTKVLKMRVPPSNFSGPPHLKRLQGKCFSVVQENYKYEFCPFSNVTQHEQSLSWNPYSGILGVWQEWEIMNNTFTSMLMQEGDTCGKVRRTVKVSLHCGTKNEIEKVTEPETCHYHMIFNSPLVCHNHSLLVYPTLSEVHRDRWDIIETRLYNKEITLKGYKRLLNELFVSTGYLLDPSQKEIILKEAEEKEKETTTKSFDSISECNTEFLKLKDEITRLQTLLESNHIQYKAEKADDDTVVHHHGEKFDDYEQYRNMNDPDSMDF